ncbi:2-pyrone-4,6-dicarboxylate hydrolase [Pigmentiphaga litoralis]|uniref:amidohydrolase family protein n=1 Tax=Pigmentiphaga litoralis TaxID=516702 RepID=UPI001675056B|nr:amidohydrolase family protein [Pigmentiphaga litoralis]GGX21543.1 2-pyrone-4,6-dicarboxylate hydrolase [Pigmentiphaga litoralis]
MTNTSICWDCHTHVFGPWSRFPLPDAPAYRPEAAPFDALRAVHRACGITHGVLVQAACYGADHAALLDALSTGDGRYRGIALIDPDVDEAVLADMHDRGVRGVRLGLMPHLPAAQGTSRLRDVLARIQPYGWHALLHAPIDTAVATLTTLADPGVPLVVDHMGRPAAEARDSRAVDALVDHLARPDVWIKVSGADRVSAGRRPFNDALPLMRRLLRAAPSRAIWGTDWPHVNITSDRPDVAELLGLLTQACDGMASLDDVLHTNPARLYA